MLETSSRYADDFQEIGLLGSGGFGLVRQVKNKLDGQHYAVKIIRINNALHSQVDKVFREVKLLAGITHRNVVRYYTSWLQHVALDAASDTEDESIISESDCDSLHLGLFIQMELCTFTLYEWLEKRNATSNPNTLYTFGILNCLQDLLNGLKAIHDHKYIHRDMKPRNIFWKGDIAGPNSGSGTWKIGDFGLATNSTLFSADNSHAGTPEHTSDIGTLTVYIIDQVCVSRATSSSEQTILVPNGHILARNHFI